MTLQTTLPITEPRASETETGQRILRAIREHGPARVLRHGPLYVRQLDREIRYRGACPGEHGERRGSR